MTDQEFCSHNGVYQAYSWQQGSVGQAVTFRIPDENFMYSRDFKDPMGFDLVKFFEVVSEVDDGDIHYWCLNERDGDLFLTLACTEDDSMAYMGRLADVFSPSSLMLDRVKSPEMN